MKKEKKKTLSNGTGQGVAQQKCYGSFPFVHAYIPFRATAYQKIYEDKSSQCQ